MSGNGGPKSSSGSGAPRSGSVAPPSIDSILSAGSSSLAPGESLSFSLVRSHRGGHPGDPEKTLLAKFAGTVIPKPTFVANGDKSSAAAASFGADGAGVVMKRMWEEEVPKAKDDSDDEEVVAKRRRRPRRRRPPLLRWIMDGGKKNFQYRYAGTHERNESKYVLLSVDPTMPTGEDGRTRLVVTPVDGWMNFVKDSSIKRPSGASSGPTRGGVALSLSEAEALMNDRRRRQAKLLQSASAAEEGAAAGGGGKTSRRSRLLSRMMAGSGDQEDDVMADLAYRERKGGGKARMEILQSLGDGLRADEDGVMGGGNDAEFGGSRRFGAVKTETPAENPKKKGGKGGGGSSAPAAGNDGNAMADDFYQRDVGAEYEEMDYDPADEFQDDDVDVQGDVEGPESNIGNNMDDDVDDDDDAGGDGASGLASSAGLRAMMAKAYGEDGEPDKKDAADAGTTDAEGKKTTAYNRSDDPVTTAVVGTKGTGGLPADVNVGGLMPPSASPPGADPGGAGGDDGSPDGGTEGDAHRSGFIEEDTGPMFDSNGLRVITKKAIQQEIWLARGAIELKRFTDIFGISTRGPKDAASKKIRAERKKVMVNLVSELCTKRSDPQQGVILVLKPHYAKM